MDCKEFERQIPKFIGDQLDYSAMKRFCGHLEHCADCREELVIQFLVAEGVQRLEDGEAFDLQKELDRKLNRVKKKMRVHRNMQKIGTVMGIAALCVLAGIAVWLLI